MPVPVDKYLFPPEFVSRCRQSGRAAFLSEFADTLLLLIKLQSLEAPLATTLLRGSSSRTLPVMPSKNLAIGYATILTTSPFQSAAREEGHRDRSVTAARLAIGISRSCHFVAPLRKRVRDGKPFLDRISIGRATNNDIVLRDESVSKFHAWFECDEEGVFYVTDARSRNGTYVNGKAVGQVAALRSGDSLQMGSVEAILCAADVFWELLTT